MQQLLTGPVRRFIHAQSTRLEVYRQNEDTDEEYGTNPDYTSIGQRVLAFGGLQESMQPTAGGEIQSQRLVAYSLPDEDIQEDDRLDHGGSRMEIVASFGLPNEQEPAIIRHELEDA